jgi:Tol biopolymer transport system component
LLGALLLAGCAGGDEHAAAPTPTSLFAEFTRTAAMPTATATPRASRVVVEPEPAFVPPASARRTLVVRSGRASLGVDTDTGAVRTLLTYPEPQLPLYPPYVFSPDGLSYAFACAADGSVAEASADNLCVAGAWNVVATPAPDEQFGDYRPHEITWSPDAMRLAFKRRNRESGGQAFDNVEVLDLRTLKTTRVIQNRGHEPWGPVTWAPDSGAFAIQRNWSGGSGSSDLFVVDAATGMAVELGRAFAGGVRFAAPAWSPDGQRVAFVGLERNALDDLEAVLYVADRDGTGVAPIMRGALSSEIAWSPDGERIAVRVATRGVGLTDVFVVRGDGSEERALPESLEGTGPSSWAPDSSHLALAASRGGHTDLFVTSIRGAEPRGISASDFPGYPQFIAWSPDGKRLFFIQGGGCGKGGCSPGFLHMADLEAGGVPVRLHDEPVDELLGFAP